MMKKRYLAWICLVCLILAGCRSTQDTLPPADEPTINQTTPAVPQEPAEEAEDAVPEAPTGEPEDETQEAPAGETDDEAPEQPDTPTILPAPEEDESPALSDVEDGILQSDLNVENTGKLRLQYTGNQSSVRYVTSVSQLPDQEQFKMYDEAYFQDHALLLILETVGSGSVQVGIGAITVDGDTATVTLSHHMPGDVGTTDMATWLLWAEVDAGLELRWSIANPALQSNSSTH